MATRRIRVVFLLRNNLAKKELQSGKGKTCFKKLLNYAKQQMHIKNAQIRDERSGFLLRYFNLICQLRLLPFS